MGGLGSIKEGRWFSGFLFVCFFVGKRDVLVRRPHGRDRHHIWNQVLLLQVTPEELGEVNKDEEKENLDLNGIPMEDRSPDSNEENSKV